MTDNENEQTETPTATTRRTRTPKPQGEVDVTMKYKTTVDDVPNKRETTKPPPLNFNHAQPAPIVPRNTLAFIANTLTEYVDEENTQFSAVIMRLRDLPTDNFSRPCLETENFPIALTVAPQDILTSFTAYLLKFNGNSGGRFDVYFCYESGEAIDEAVLKNFRIPEPVKIMQPETVGSVSNSESVLEKMFAMMQANQKASDERFEKILANIQTKPEKTLLEQITEVNAIKAALGGNENEFNPNKIIEQVFGSAAVIETMSEKLSGAFGEKKEPKNGFVGFLESPLGEKVATRVLDVGERFGQFIPALLMSKAQQQPTQQPQNAQVINQNPNNETEDDLTDEEYMIQEIIAELESTNVIDAENLKIKELTIEFPAQFQMIKTIASATPFEDLFKMLMQQYPQIFAEFIELDGEQKPQLNERGQKVYGRLNEFYEFIKT